MYFNAETQAKVLSRFHFALNGEGTGTGYLFLGRAEMMLSHTQLFVPLELKCRLFQKVAQPGARSRAAAPARPEAAEPTQKNADGAFMTDRMDRLREFYPWMASGLDYFTGRLTQAPEDAEFALAWVVKHARTREEQDAAHAALRAKCDILWAMLDALYFAYVQPGWPPPGAFHPDKADL